MTDYKGQLQQCAWHMPNLKTSINTTTILYLSSQENNPSSTLWPTTTCELHLAKLPQYMHNTPLYSHMTCTLIPQLCPHFIFLFPCLVFGPCLAHQLMEMYFSQVYCPTDPHACLSQVPCAFICHSHHPQSRLHCPHSRHLVQMTCPSPCTNIGTLPDLHTSCQRPHEPMIRGNIQSFDIVIALHPSRLSIRG